MSDTDTIERPVTVIIPEETAFSVFTAEAGIDPYLALVRKEIDSFVTPDVQTAAGRKEIASFAFKVGKIKNYIEDTGKKQAAVAKAIPKLIDATRRKAFDTLEGWQAEVRKPLTDWEEAEKKRTDELEGALAEVQRTASFAVLDPSAEEINGRLGYLSELMPRDWQEYAERAAEAGRTARATLIELRDATVKRDQDSAELNRLRAEAEARAAKEREEQLAREAEDERQRIAEAAVAAEREKIEDERRSIERRRVEGHERALQSIAGMIADACSPFNDSNLIQHISGMIDTMSEMNRDWEEFAEQFAETVASGKARIADRLTVVRLNEKLRAEEAADKAESDRLQAITDSERKTAEAVQAELRRIEGEKAQSRAEAERREADEEHRAEIDNAAAEAFAVCGIDPAIASAVVDLIAQKKIPNISISY